MSDYEMVMFDPASSDSSNLPAHLQGLGLGVSQSLMAAIGDQLNRIGLKGSRFRQIINGQEVGVFEENYLDVIIVGVVPSVSRIYYAGKFSQKGDNDPPTCYSVDNVAPPIDLPTRQSDACATCRWNVKGSKIADDGSETKACGYFRRVVVMLPGDNSLYRLDVKAQGLFGDDNEKLNKYSLNGYAKFLNTRGVDASVLVTRLSFDTNNSVPKLFFSPNRWIGEEEVAQVQELTKGNDLAQYLEVKFKTIDLSKETAAEEAEADVPAAAAPNVTRQAAPQAAPKPAVQAAKPTPAPARTVPAPAAKPAPAPAQRPVAAAPQQARPAVQAAKPATQAAKPTPQAAAKPVQKAAPIEVQADIPYTEQAEVTEVGSNDELLDIIADLGI
jgi:hypothetical protein